MKKADLYVIGIAIVSLGILSFMEHPEEPHNNYDKKRSLQISTIQLEPAEIKIEDSTTNLHFESITSQKTLTDFKKSIGFKESSNNYKAINRLGYLGKYQFGKSTLRDLGLHKISNDEFLNDNELQELAMQSLLQINKYRLRKFMNYSGQKINGILVTESGILAAAHLVGSNSVKKWLRSDGKTNRADANGTTVETYMSLFSGYDMSSIKPIRKIKLK